MLAQLEQEETLRRHADFEAETGMTADVSERLGELGLGVSGNKGEGYVVEDDGRMPLFPPMLAPGVERKEWVMGTDMYPRAPWEIVERFILRVKERDLRGLGRGGPPREVEEWDIVRRVLKRKQPGLEAPS